MRIEESPSVYLQKECPLCHSTELKPIKTERNTFPKGVRPEVEVFNNTWIQLMKCSECEFCFTKEIPTDKEFFPARYDIEFDPALETQNDFKRDVLKQIFRMLKKHGRTGGALLDIGSFAGIFLQEARKQGYEISGVEVNPTMANYTKEKSNLNIFNGTFFDFPCEDNSFDTITLIDVLEHLLEPREILEKCYRILKPGGHILIKVPNGQPQIFKQNIANFLGITEEGTFATFGHINHFSPKSLGNILSRVGFTPLECVVAESEIWLQDTLKVKLKNGFRKIVYLCLESIRKVTGFNFGLNINYIAIKK